MSSKGIKTVSFFHYPKSIAFCIYWNSGLLSYYWVGKWLKSLRLNHLSHLLKHLGFIPEITVNSHSLQNCGLEFHRHDWTGQTNSPFDDALEMLFYQCWCFYPWKLPWHVCGYLPFQWTWNKPHSLGWCLCRILYVRVFQTTHKFGKMRKKWKKAKLLIVSIVQKRGTLAW